MTNRRIREARNRGCVAIGEKGAGGKGEVCLASSARIHFVDPYLRSGESVMATRQEILDEIRKLSARLGVTPGKRLFENETGIKEGEWYGVHWSRWNELVREAGIETNQKTEKLPRDFMLKKYADAVRNFGRIPVASELRMYSRTVEGVPNEKTFTREFGGKQGLVTALSQWVREQQDYADIVPLIPEMIAEEPATPIDDLPEGSVYLLRSGQHFKIGRSDQLEQRVKQITISLPEKVTLEHTIRTDDPPGIEAYWHRRFAEKRANGEWFRLSPADVRAFKRRKFQ